MTEHDDVEALTPRGVPVVVSRRGLLTAGTVLASLTAVGVAPAAVAVPADPPGVIYAVNRSSKDLYWYRHQGRNNGSVSWANNGQGRRVGTGWDFEHVFAGANGVIYAVQRGSKDLYWYRHEGRNNGSVSWANNGQGRRVGTGWDFEHVF